jgi:hypothetical protein
MALQLVPLRGILTQRRTVPISFGIIFVTVVFAFSNLLRAIVLSLFTYTTVWILIKLGIYRLWLVFREDWNSLAMMRKTEEVVRKMKEEVRKQVRKREAKRNKDKSHKEKEKEREESKTMKSKACDDTNKKSRRRRWWKKNKGKHSKGKGAAASQDDHVTGTECSPDPSNTMHGANGESLKSMTIPIPDYGKKGRVKLHLGSQSVSTEPGGMV